MSGSWTRRRFLGIGTAGLAGAMVSHWVLPVRAAAADRGAVSARLVPGPTSIRLAPDAAVKVNAWAYNGQVPGPLLRAVQGATLTVDVTNRLKEPTTVHWHGLRVPVAMDGVPYLSQPPIEPGASFQYAFTVSDAGTFWYHPHMNSAEQLGRGLSGPLIVDEREPPRVDREFIWFLDDWRIHGDGRLAEDFLNRHDKAHAGRIGNWITVNGERPQAERVRRGERLRIRLINGANARVFKPRFDPGAEAWVIAVDGHPLEPHRLDGDGVILGPAMRLDLMVDVTGEAGDTIVVVDHYDEPYTLMSLDIGGEAPVRDHLLDPPRALAPNPVPEPQLDDAVKAFDLEITGGAGGRMRSAVFQGREVDPRELLWDHGLAWAFNGVARSHHDVHHDPQPLFRVARDRTCLLRIRNQTRWPHPIHLHGHAFRVLKRNGQATSHRRWQDTVHLEPDDTVEVAFVADNPGVWMLHCHVLEHQSAGMQAVVEVT